MATQSSIPHSQLHPNFIDKAPHPLKMKRGCKSCSDFDCLPFVASRRTPTDSPYSLTDSPYWDVAPTGGYIGGLETGKAMALAFLKYLRAEEGDDSLRPHDLARIAESFMVRFEEEGGKAMSKLNAPPKPKQSESFSSLKGQYIGFFSALCRWLWLSARCLGDELDYIGEKDLVARANIGLGFNTEGFMNSLPDEE